MIVDFQNTPIDVNIQLKCPLKKYTDTFLVHDDIMKWKQFPGYWPFVWVIHRSPVNSPHKGPVTRSFDVFFDLRLYKRLSKQSICWWFEMPSCSLWHYCNELKLKYSGWKGSIPWLMMNWLLAWPGHKKNMALIMQDKWDLALHNEGFQLPVPS